jgi:PX domain
METSMELLQFSDRERKYYSQEFEQITSEQMRPIGERELMGQTAAQFFRQLKISDSDLSTIWELVCERRAYLKLPNFMAAMRLCSAIKQGKPLTKQSYLIEQNVLARRTKGLPNKNPVEEEKKNENEDTKKINVIEEVKFAPEKKIEVVDNTVKETPSIPLQISQEVLLPSNRNKPELVQIKNFSKFENSISEETLHDIPLFPDNVRMPDPKPKEINFGPNPHSIRKEVKIEPKPKPEEQNAPLKLFPKLSKVYKSDLTQIEEESCTPKNMSKDSIISVEKPVLISSGWLGGKSYHLYTIITRSQSNIFTVKRRFSDMDWMHNQLVAKHKGFIIPSRPDKKIIKNTDEKFIEERRLQMEKYLSIIAKHPILGTSAPFKTFTQTPNEKFEKEKAKVEASDDYQEYHSIEDAVDKVFALVQNKFQIIFSQKIIPFSKEMSEIEEKLIKLEAPTQTLSGAFSGWVQNKVEGVKILSSMKLGNDFLSVISQYKSISRSNSQELVRLTLEIKEEQLRLEGLKEALNSYKGTVEECCKLQTLITRKLGKHKSSSDEDTAARYLSEIQSTQDTIDKYNKSLSKIEENVIKENSSFDMVKNEHLETTIKEIIISQNNYYHAEASFWKGCLRDFSLPS